MPLVLGRDLGGGFRACIGGTQPRSGLFTRGTESHNTFADTLKRERPIYNWGVEWELYFVSGRASATKFISIEPLLFWAFNWTPEKRDQNDYFIRMQHRILSDLRANRPKYFVITAPFVMTKSPEYTLPKELDLFARENYREELNDPPFKVLRRIEP